MERSATEQQGAQGSLSGVAWPTLLGPVHVGSPTNIACVCRSRSLAALTAAEKVPRPMIAKRCPARLIESQRMISWIKARLSRPSPPPLWRRSMTRYSACFSWMKSKTLAEECYQRLAGPVRDRVVLKIDQSLVGQMLEPVKGILYEQRSRRRGASPGVNRDPARAT